MSPTNTNPPPAPPPITPGDRLGLTLCLAVIVHAVVVLGITFSPEEEKPPRYEPLDITLVQKQSEAPDEADYLAQADLEGGGDSEETERPSTPVPATFPKNEARVTAPPPVEQMPPPPEKPTTEIEQPEPVPEPPQEIEQVAVKTPDPAPIEPTETRPEKPQQPAKPEQPEPEPETPAKPEPEVKTDQPVKEKTTKPRPTPSAAELMSTSMEMAALSAEIQRKLKAKAERPRRKFISASTQEYKYASYMEAWRAKVERVGNLNYPEEARKRGLTGSLILDVALKPNGSVDEITVRKSSGNKILDDAAIRIVNLAAPFAPFPDNIRAETDILHITRTWQFLHGERFR